MIKRIKTIDISLKDFLIIYLLLTIISCKNISNPWSPEFADSEWLIDEDFIQGGCFSGKDCIPSLEQPERSSITGPYLDFLSDEDLVVGIFNGEKYVAYPHSILAWHEVINEPGYCISFCPLTGSALHQEADGEFGVSGLLYNANLIMYDRDTESYWPQMFLRSASGERMGEAIALRSMVETTWENWKALFPDSDIINSNTSYTEIYEEFGYGYDKLDDQKAVSGYVPVPLSRVDERLPGRERVLAIVSGTSATAFVISEFKEPEIISFSKYGVQYRIVVSGRDNIAVGFQTSAPLSIKTWDIPAGDLIIENNQTGEEFNILGKSLNLPLTLPMARSFTSYWFALPAIYENVEIYRP
jgi:hypothetical protein